MLGFVTSLTSLVFTRKALAPGPKKTIWAASAIIAAGTLLLAFFAVESKLAYGVSITDGCIGWEETESLLLEAHGRLAT